MLLLWHPSIFFSKKPEWFLINENCQQEISQHVPGRVIQKVWFGEPDSSQNWSHWHISGWAFRGAAPARSTKHFPWALAPHLALKTPHEGEGAAFTGKITRIKSPGASAFVKVLPALMSSVISNALFPWDGQPRGKFPALLKMIHPQLQHQHTWEPALGCACSYLSAWTASSDTEGNITFMELWEWKIFFPAFEQSSLNLNTLMRQQTISQCTHLSW